MAAQSEVMVTGAGFIRPHLRKLKAYTPIEPFEVLSKKLGKNPKDIVKLDANENPYGPPSEVLEALGNMQFPNVYPDPETRALRKALADWQDVPMEHLLVRTLLWNHEYYLEYYQGLSFPWFSVNNLIKISFFIFIFPQVGCGADELIDLLMRCVLEPGDKILDCPPTFTMYVFDAAVNAAEVVTVPRLPGFKIDIDGKN